MRGVRRCIGGDPFHREMDVRNSKGGGDGGADWFCAMATFSIVIVSYPVWKKNSGIHKCLAELIHACHNQRGTHFAWSQKGGACMGGTTSSTLISCLHDTTHFAIKCCDGSCWNEYVQIIVCQNKYHLTLVSAKASTVLGAMNGQPSMLNVMHIASLVALPPQVPIAPFRQVAGWRSGCRSACGPRQDLCSPLSFRTAQGIMTGWCYSSG